VSSDTNLVKFLTAQFDKDERAASALHDIAICKLAINGPTDPRWGWECDCEHPARVLADVDAKRQIVAECAFWLEGDDGLWSQDTRANVAWLIAALLALPYADQPDYDEAWRP
jgi:hypothetical protein